MTTEWLTTIATMAESLVPALLHTLWQAPIVAVIAAIVLRFVSADRSATRYGVALTGLLLTVGCGLTTWAIFDHAPPTTTTPATTPAESSSVEVADVTTTETDDRLAETHNTSGHIGVAAPIAASHTSWTTVIGAVWLMGVVVMLARTAALMHGAGQLRQTCEPVANDELTRLFDELVERMGIGRHVRLAMSQAVRVPAALGVIWPTVLLPVEAITQIPASHWRAIIAHELAHIRRYDYVVNIGQLMIEAVLFFNPAVWWLSRQVRVEREACCDAWAVRIVGEPVSYAKTLADWGQRLGVGSDVKWDGDWDGGQVAMGFAGDDQGGSMLDRVRRVLVIGHRPSVRLPWYMLAAALLVGGLMLAVLKVGSDAVVAKVLTPAERIERLVEIEQTHGSAEHKEYGPEDEIEISGEVTVAEGLTMPEKVRFSVYSRRPSHMTTCGVRYDNGRFNGKVPFGKVTLAVQADGFAPTFAESLEADPGGKIENIKLTLDHGFDGRVRLVDEHDKPIVCGKVTGRYDFDIHIAKFDMTSDQSGVVTIPRCADYPVLLTAECAGYQFEYKTFELSADEVATWRLLKATPASGVIVDRETGKPVIDAEVRELAVVHGSHTNGVMFSDARVRAKTDEQGRFTLPSLRDDSIYHYAVVHPKYCRYLLYDVTAGKNGLRVELGPPLVVKGRIIGPLDGLRKERGKPIIHYSNPYSVPNGSGYSEMTRVELELVDGEARFEIRDLWPGEVQVSVGDEERTLQLEDDSITDLVFDLTPEAQAAKPKRTIVIDLVPPKGMPKPTGRINVHTRTGDRKESLQYDHKRLALEDGRVELELAMPAKVSCRMLDVTGYWFRETKGLDIEPADEPFLIEVPVLPAGSIFGRVLDADGMSVEDASVSVVQIKEAEGIVIKGSLGIDNIRAAPRYSCASLPLGGTYGIVAYMGHAFVESEPVELTEANPMREVSLQFVQGEPVDVRVLDDQGKPLAGMDVNLSYSTRFNQGYSPVSRATDRDGRVRFERVNPNVDGTYTLTVAPASTFLKASQKITPGDGLIEVTLERGRQVTGVVLDDETGWPIPGAEVYATAAQASSWRVTNIVEADAKTDKQGRYVLTRLANEPYHLHVRSGKPAKRGDITVGPKDSKAPDMRVTLHKWSDLKPRRP